MTQDDRKAVDALGDRFDHISEKLFTKISEVKDSVASLDKSFAVHVEKTSQDRDRLDSVQESLDDIKPKIDVLWGIDRMKLWVGRSVVTVAIGVIVYGVKHWLGW